MTMGCRVRSVAASSPALAEMREDEPPGAREIGADMTTSSRWSSMRNEDMADTKREGDTASPSRGGR